MWVLFFGWLVNRFQVVCVWGVFYLLYNFSDFSLGWFFEYLVKNFLDSFYVFQFIGFS